MCYEQKLNSITRLVILISILGYILTMSLRILGVGALTLLIIFVLFTMRKQKITKEMMNEGFGNNGFGNNGFGNNGFGNNGFGNNGFGNNIEFGNNALPNDSYVNPVTLDSVLKSEFKEGNRKNPFSNVLLTQIGDNPERKSAPPSFNVDVSEDITENVKKAVQMMNPGIKNTNKQLYGDLWQNFLLDDSNRVFYSNSNTRVEPGNQSAFGKYLYGDLPSSKGSDFASAVQREKDAFRYTLY
jgi:hypothetical protein